MLTWQGQFWLSSSTSMRFWSGKRKEFLFGHIIMYVPEVHPITKLQFHEREDEAHVFKV